LIPRSVTGFAPSVKRSILSPALGLNELGLQIEAEVNRVRIGFEWLPQANCKVCIQSQQLQLYPHSPIPAIMNTNVNRFMKCITVLDKHNHLRYQKMTSGTRVLVFSIIKF
jgi:hypothetical protein